MEFYIEFEAASIGKIDPLKIGSFSFISGMFNVYAGARLLLKDFAKEHNNNIRTGMKVYIHFTDSEKDRHYTVEMSVLSFRKVSGPSTTDYIDVVLTSSSYFSNKISTAAHSGTVSQIMSSIYSNTDIGKGYSSFNMDTSSDIERVRYQLSERNMDFMDRISKYGYVNGRPMYLFSDAMGNLNFRSVDNMEKSGPGYVVESFLFQQSGGKSEESSLSRVLTPKSIDIGGANKDSISKYTSIFDTSLFVSSGKYSSSIVSNGNENGNASSEEVSPEKVEFYGWNTSPEDSLGMAARKNYERMVSTYTVDLVFDSFLIEEMNIGNVMYVILPYNPTARSSNGSSVNAGEGKYMVTKVSLIYESGMLNTHAHLVQIGY